MSCLKVWDYLEITGLGLQQHNKLGSHAAAAVQTYISAQSCGNRSNVAGLPLTIGYDIKYITHHIISYHIIGP